MTFRTAIRARVDKIRGQVPGRLDLRPHTVTVRVRTWTGARAGLGTKTDVDTDILNAGYNPKVEEVSTRDIIASGGVYTSGNYRVGPITPEYPGGGTAGATLDPATTSTAREVFYRIVGPGFPTSGAWFTRVDDAGLASFRNEVVLKRSAVTP